MWLVGISSKNDDVGWNDLEVTFPSVERKERGLYDRDILNDSPKIFMTLGIHGVVNASCGCVVWLSFIVMSFL